MATRWGILGTANIGRRSFIPAVAKSAGSVVAVGSRDQASADQYGESLGIPKRYEGYRRLLEDPAIDAVYIALPNSLHEEWTIRALEAGKHVLCEKPLATHMASLHRILDVARKSSTHLWEAFVFPFHAQTQRIRDMIGQGRIGALVRIEGAFHFVLDDPENVRWSQTLEGGALNDVGCYPIHLARQWFGEAGQTVAMARLKDGVDAEVEALIRYPGGKSLSFGAGFTRAGGTWTRFIGTEGSILLSNPFHPRRNDRMYVFTGSDVESFDASDHDETFFDHIHHIDRVIAGEEGPRHLAQDDTPATTQAIEMIRTRWVEI